MGMEPSSLAVFRDEMQRILPNNQDAKRMQQNCYHWAEFFDKQHVELPKLDGKAILWGHCHHKATGGIGPELKMLKEHMGLDAAEAKGGCCGLAGSFGFAPGKYDISMQCGEVGLLPAARNADPSTMIIANGFSCKTQLNESNVGRHALHMREVMRIARMLGGLGVNGKFPEQLRAPKPEPSRRVKIARRAAVVGLCAGAALAGATLATSMWQTDESR